MQDQCQPLWCPRQAVPGGPLQQGRGWGGGFDGLPLSLPVRGRWWEPFKHPPQCYFPAGAHILQQVGSSREEDREGGLMDLHRLSPLDKGGRSLLTQVPTMFLPR